MIEVLIVFIDILIINDELTVDIYSSYKPSVSVARCTIIIVFVRFIFHRYDVRYHVYDNA
jgi:hypothetical protein